MHELAGKAAVITGASRGIGRAAALELARLGVNVVAAARSMAALETLVAEIHGAGGNAVAAACDVANYADLAAAVNSCRDTFGGLDLMINNAGVIEPIGPLAESDPEAWAHAADINYKGVYYGVRAALPLMRERGSGVIVNLSSGAATSAMEGWSHYCSSKAAALSLTRCAHVENVAAGVRVIGLSPGTVATEMQVLIKASGINPVSQLDPSVHIPPALVAQAISWLCTDAAREFDGDDVSLRSPDLRQRMGLA
jgi:3-oxoacyl-[acyl-carrier protein] reductase